MKNEYSRYFKHNPVVALRVIYTNILSDVRTHLKYRASYIDKGTLVEASHIDKALLLEHREGNSKIEKSFNHIC